MDRIRGLELLFNLEKKNLKSKDDCIVAVFHCLLINQGYQCVGTGDAWPESITTSTELLPKDWNSDQSLYALRYITADKKSRILLKITKMEHILQADAVLNEDAVSSISVPVENYVDSYDEYCTAYKDLKALCDSFFNDIVNKLQPPETNNPHSTQSQKESSPSSSNPFPGRPLRKPEESQPDRLRQGPPRVPNIGGRDLNPFGGGGGMLMDPSNFGIPGRPTLPEFGVGGPGGLPPGAVPPGARFDPFMPPIHPVRRFEPDPDHMLPPDYDSFM